MKGKTAIILLFIDDLLITGNGPDLIAALKLHLQSKYEDSNAKMKDLAWHSLSNSTLA